MTFSTWTEHTIRIQSRRVSVTNLLNRDRTHKGFHSLPVSTRIKSRRVFSHWPSQQGQNVLPGLEELSKLFLKCAGSLVKSTATKEHEYTDTTSAQAQGLGRGGGGLPQTQKVMRMRGKCLSNSKRHGIFPQNGGSGWGWEEAGVSQNQTPGGVPTSHVQSFHQTYITVGHSLKLCAHECCEYQIRPTFYEMH